MASFDVVRLVLSSSNFLQLTHLDIQVLKHDGKSDLLVLDPVLNIPEPPPSNAPLTSILFPGDWFACSQILMSASSALHFSVGSVLCEFQLM